MEKQPTIANIKLDKAEPKLDAKRRRSLFKNRRSLPVMAHSSTSEVPASCENNLLQDTARSVLRNSGILPDNTTASTDKNSDEYTEKLLKENEDWYRVYNSLKDEYRSLKKENNTTSISSSHHEDYLQFVGKINNYLEQAKDLFQQMEVIEVMNDHIVKFKGIRKAELEREVQIMDKLLVESLEK